MYISENADDLEKKINDLSNNRQLITEMKKNAINLASMFSYENQYQKIVNLINKMS